MKKIYFFSTLILLPFLVFAFDDEYDISEIYVEIDIGYETYYAEIDSGSISSILQPEFGQVKKIYKRSRTMDFGYGKYIIKIKWLKDDMYIIVGSPYLVKINFASHYEFDGYNEWILDTTSGLYGKVLKRRSY